MERRRPSDADSPPPTTAPLSRRALLRRALGLGGAATLLAACGGAPAAPTGDAGATPTAGAAPATEATSAPASAAVGSRAITWYMNIDATRNAWAEKIAIPGFQKENPDITVNLMTVPFEEHDSKLLSLNAAGTPADVFAQWGQSGGGTYFYKGLIQPVEDLIAAHGWDLKNVPEVLQNAYSFEGKRYGIPMYSLGSFIFYNKALFEEAKVEPPPLDWEDASWTWDEMVARAQKLTADYGDRDKARYGLHIEMPDLYGGVPWLFGADMFDPADYKLGRATKVNLTSPEAVAAIQAKADLVHKHKVSPNPTTLEALAAGGNLLGTGKVAMIYGGGWGFWSLKDLKDVQWGVGAVPRQKTNTIPNFSDPWYIAKGSKDPEAAFRLVKYLTTGTGQRDLAVALAAPPADQTLLDVWYKNFPTIDAADLEKVYKGALAHAKETPASTLYGYGPVEDAYNQTTAPIWQGEKSAAEVLPEVEKRANEALKNLT